MRIVSELPLSGLLLCDAAGWGEIVTIRHASVPKILPDSVSPEEGVAYDGNSLLLAIPEVARYLVRGGNEILVDAEPFADKNDIRAYLLGSAFGTLCHQRGIVPLHSAAIDVKDGCIGFIGYSGSGKSTLAASLTARGHQVIADDVSFLWLDSTGKVMCWPGIGRIRLWEDAVAALGCNGPGVEREFRGYNKFLVPVRPPVNPFAPRRLRRVYHLKAGPAGSTTNVSQVQGATAIELLMQNVYGSPLDEYMGRRPATFALCAALARQVPVFQFTRPMGFDALHAGVEVLENHLRDIY